MVELPLAILLWMLIVLALPIVAVSIVGLIIYLGTK
jgi:type III secretory pathway component EscS